MGLLAWFAPRPAEALISELAGTIAAECHEGVWQHVAHRAGTIASASEARSYLRVRATGIVHREAKRILRADQRIRARSTELVMDRAIGLIVARLTGPMLPHEPAGIATRRVA